MENSARQGRQRAGILSHSFENVNTKKPPFSRWFFVQTAQTAILTSLGRYFLCSS
jgi:hypothetical protein